MIEEFNDDDFFVEIHNEDGTIEKVPRVVPIDSNNIDAFIKYYELKGNDEQVKRFKTIKSLLRFKP